MAVLPGHLHGRRSHHFARRRSQIAPIRHDCIAINGCSGQFTVGRGHQRYATPLHGRKRAPPHRLPHKIGATEVGRERHFGGQARDLRPQHRLDPRLLTPVARGHRKRCWLELGWQREGITFAGERRSEPILSADPQRGLLGPRAGFPGEVHFQVRRLTVRYDDGLRQGLDPRKGEAFDRPPGGEESCPGVGGGIWDKNRRSDSQRDRYGSSEHPATMPWPRHGSGQVEGFCPLGHLADGRLAESQRAVANAGG